METAHVDVIVLVAIVLVLGLLLGITMISARTSTGRGIACEYRCSHASTGCGRGAGNCAYWTRILFLCVVLRQGVAIVLAVVVVRPLVLVRRRRIRHRADLCA